MPRRRPRIDGRELARSVRSRETGEEGLEAGALVLGAEARVLHVDASATALLREATLYGREDPWDALARLVEEPGQGRQVMVAVRHGEWLRLRLVPVRPRGGRTLVCIVSRFQASGAARFEAEATRVGLTPREREVARLAIRGLSNQEISRELGCTASTVRLHLVSVFRKAGVGGRAELGPRFLGAAP